MKATPPTPPLVEDSPSYMARFLDLLELAVSDRGSTQSVSELAEIAGMPVSTTSRLLGHLRSWGFLAEVPGGRYAPGPRMVSISAAVARATYGKPRLQETTRVLAAATGESATAGRVIGDQIVIVARTESDRALRAVNRTGEVVPAGRSAMGKAILSLLPPHRRLDFLRADGGSDPEAALAALTPELQETADRGYAVDEEALAVGLRCRAVPIIGWDGMPVGALSVGGPSVRFSVDLADASVPPLRTQAAELAGERS